MPRIRAQPHLKSFQDLPRLPRPSWSLALVVLIAYGSLLLVSLSELNPDWLAYRLFYEDGGAWLSEQGRDPAFLALNALLGSLFGPGGYDAYRSFLACYFLAFTIALARGRVLRLQLRGSGHVVAALAMIYVGFARFTIQIREGVAITLLLLALGLFERAEGQPTPASRKFQALGWVVIVLAALTHAAAIFVVVVLVVARMATPQSAEPTLLAGRYRAICWASALVTLVGLAQLNFGGALESLAADTVGDRLFFESTELNPAQLAFWAIYGVVCLVLLREVKAITTTEGRHGLYSSFLRVLAGPAVISTYATIVGALLLSVSPLLVANYTRLLHLFLALVLLMVAASGHRRWPLFAIGLFLIADQLRIIAAAISIYFGVDLLPT